MRDRVIDAARFRSFAEYMEAIVTEMLLYGDAWVKISDGSAKQLRYDDSGPGLDPRPVPLQVVMTGDRLRRNAGNLIRLHDQQRSPRAVQLPGAGTGTGTADGGDGQ